jgi:hypothetical protein
VTIIFQREHFSQILFIIIGKVAKICPIFSWWGRGKSVATLPSTGYCFNGPLQTCCQLRCDLFWDAHLPSQNWKQKRLKWVRGMWISRKAPFQVLTHSIPQKLHNIPLQFWGTLCIRCHPLLSQKF